MDFTTVTRTALHDIGYSGRNLLWPVNLTDGRRKDLLMKAAEAMFVQDFVGRILPFDTASSLVYADIRSRRQRTGTPISVFDAQIAAISILYSATLVTRNIPDFRDCGITLINPWTDD